MKILVIIPARGGSKGIPRKNLRPLNGKPLIYYSVKLALSSDYNPDVYVSTDDKEIAFFAKKYGAKVHWRNTELATDKVTLDPVIYNAYKVIKDSENKEYDYVITLQSTSPLLRTASLDSAIDKIVNGKEITTIISAINDTHLSWKKSNNSYLPNYEKRVNRQQLPQIYKETGSFFISHYSVVREDSRIGEKVDLFELPSDEAIDIDTYEDWALCEYYLKKKTIVFNVAGYQEIGLGHVYNCLILANEILDHRIKFIVDSKSDLAFEKISASNYEVYQQKTDDLVEEIASLNPDLVINDVLDTNEEFILNLKYIGIKILNFEDLGAGAVHADLVVNAIYPETEVLPNHYFGAQYFCARDEFLIDLVHNKTVEVKNILISFGGVDPNNLTYKVLNSIYDYCIKHDLKITVILGLGYSFHDSLIGFSDIDIRKNVTNISDFMREADIAFSSAGRTVYELALSKTPSIILAQNKRELTHFFASSENGFINLGLGKECSSTLILDTFNKLLLNKTSREEMVRRMSANNIENGKTRVIQLIRDLINR